MDQHTLTTLEYPRIIELMQGKCRTPYGMEEISRTVPLFDRTEIETRLDEHIQMKEIITFGTAFPLYRMEDDCRKLLDRASVEGTYLSPEEIRVVLELIEISIDIKNYDPEGRDKFPAILPYLKGMRAYPELRTEINKTIDHDYSIKDSASSALKRIRRELGDTKHRLLGRLRKILANQTKKPGWQDDVITQRNGRYVIPVPANLYRSDLGMLHDRSQSGSTYFVEPAETVETNNKLNLLFQEERLEIDRILRALTAEIAKRADSLDENCALIGILDARYAGAALAKQIDANRPLISDEPNLDLKDARHPLLMVQFKDKSQVVSNSVALDASRQAIIITGPNTGGKTILLKTVGLLVLMAQSGLLIPVHEKSTVGIFRKLFTDIGDEQSIELSLSTFSSHVKNIIDAVNNLTEDSLVLFDEIGAGTDPKEGAALAEAIILRILETGAKLFVTTHYSQLKTLPLEYPELENGSLEFNRKTLAPTYKLQIGIPGSSYAVEIARRLGMPEEICDRAANALGQTERSLSELIASLETDLSRVRKDKTDLADRLNQTALLEKEYRDKLDKFDREIDDARAEALAKTSSLLDQTRRETEKLVSDIRKSQADEKAVKKLHRTVSQRKKHAEKSAGKIEGRRQPKVDPGTFEPGDQVRIISLNREGEIEELIGNQKARVAVGSVSTTVELRNLEKLDPILSKTERPPVPKITGSESCMSPEIHLRGMTVDEALEALDRFIDQALLANLSQIYVIHGKGTGTLRRTLSDYLKQHREVDSLRIGNWNEGGAGVTIAKLKS